MFSKTFFAAFAATLAVVSRADPVPSEPGPGSKFNEGSTCHIAWTVDTSATWKQMSIELMSGSNLAMNHITTVVTVDGTDPTKTTYDYPCPAVTPNSAIYFYQFTDPSTSNITWTTRFTIADATGNSVDPENATQPNGDAIPWGIGALEDPSKATPAPTRAGTNSTSAAASGSASAAVPSSSTGASAVVSSSVAVASSTSGLARVPTSSASSARTSSSATANTTTTGTAGSGTSGAETLFVGQGLLLAMGTFIAALVL